MKKCAEMG